MTSLALTLDLFYAGVFIPLFVTACCVQWNKFSKKQEVNRVMVFSTVFFGFTITFVSKKRAPKPRISYLPNGVPLPAELRSYALSVDTSDSVYPSGSDYLSIPGSAVPYRGDHPVGGIPSPNRGC